MNDEAATFYKDIIDDFTIGEFLFIAKRVLLPASCWTDFVNFWNFWIQSFESNLLKKDERPFCSLSPKIVT